MRKGNLWAARSIFGVALAFVIGYFTNSDQSRRRLPRRHPARGRRGVRAHRLRPVPMSRRKGVWYRGSSGNRTLARDSYASIHVATGRRALPPTRYAERCLGARASLVARHLVCTVQLDNRTRGAELTTDAERGRLA